MKSNQEDMITLSEHNTILSDKTAAHEADLFLLKDQIDTANRDTDRLNRQLAVRSSAPPF